MGQSRFTRSSAVFGLLLFFIVLQACGTDSISSDLDASEEREKTLFVVMGGNQTCGTDSQNRPHSPYVSGLYKAFIERVLFRALDAQTEQYVISCYEESASVYYVTHENSEDIIKSERADFERHVQTLIGDTNNTVLIGHSYGGWLTMKLALTLAPKDSTSKFDPKSYVFSIDPISRETCSFSMPFGCQEAPSDINDSQRHRIADMSTTWINFYQTNTWYLHSSGIAQADENIKVNAPHAGIDSHDKTWEVIENELAELTARI